VLEEFPGARTFPQIKVNGEIVGSYQQFEEYLENTGYNGTGYGH
jgi:glutaredoxin